MQSPVLATVGLSVRPSVSPSVIRWQFLDKLFIAKTRVLQLSVSEDNVILACVVLAQCQRVTDERAQPKLGR